jgi:iron complex transport system substrate-binding protein
MKLVVPHIIIIWALALLAGGCASRGSAFEPGESLYKPAHAAGFEIFGAGRGSSAIRITDPWQGAGGVEQWVFVSRDGEEAPAGFDGVVVKSPARRIVCLSSSYVAFLNELGAGDRIVGVSGGGFITDPLIAERVRGGVIADVGYGAALDLELLASLRADLMLVYGVGSAGDGGVTGKLREMGVPYVFVGDWLESSPQGRAEWMVAIAEMCGLFDRGTERFGRIAGAYDDLKARIASLVSGDRRPGVMLNAPYRDVWYVPGDDNYMTGLIRDAGGEWVFSGTGGRDSRPVDIEQTWVAMQRADVWLNPNDYSTLDGLVADNPRFGATPPVLRGRVFNNNARTTPAGGSDFWESGVVRPDLVLRDLAAILHPEVFAPDSLYFYKRLQ